MNARTTAQRSWALLLAVAALTVHGSGRHVHLCQDGQEPPAALHFEDGGIHADHGVGQHRDLERPLDGGLIKTVKSGLDFPALVNTAGPVFHLAFGAVAAPRVDQPRAARHFVRFIRPQLRAPPL